ncbi:MAG: hypothetical protein ACK5OP_02505 [Sphingobacteriales bacterium]|jgi:hypothetical protein
MKKIFILALILTAFVSCSKKTAEDFSKLKIQQLTKESINLGLIAYEIEDNGFEKIASLQGRLKTINSLPYDLNNSTFSIKYQGNQIAISLICPDGNKQSGMKYILNSLDKSIVDATTNEKINLNDLSIEESTSLTISLIIYNEIENRYAERIDLSSNSYVQALSAGGCDRVIASIRYTRSSATDHVKTATNNFIQAHPDCFTVHGVDAGCVWGDYGCVATQEIHCNGSGCDVPYGRL